MVGTAEEDTGTTSRWCPAPLLAGRLRVRRTELGRDEGPSCLVWAGGAFAVTVPVGGVLLGRT